MNRPIDRPERIRAVVRAGLKNGAIPRERATRSQDGVTARLAEHFDVTRQRISQIIVQEREALAHPASVIR